MRFLAAILLANSITAQADQPLDAAAIMSKVAERMEQSAEARRQYVYRQQVRTSLAGINGKLMRKESRDYSVFPGEKGTEKKLVTFQGESRKGSRTVIYSDPESAHKEEGMDAELISDFTDDMVDDKKSRDGIPHSLFPLASKDLKYYTFTMKGETEYQGRRVYRIAFEPVKTSNKNVCIHVGAEDNCTSRPWKGEAWIDAAELQPARIATELAMKIPWGVRVFLGTNLSQTGFAITYLRVAENVWFPVSYGTEFRVNVLWGYRRTMALSMQSSDFRKTDATSTIVYDVRTQ